MEPTPVISVQELKIIFESDPPFTAVKNVSFAVSKGKTLAVVGESGSGKSLTALAMMGLLPTGANMSGSILLNTGTKEIALDTLRSPEDWRTLRGAEIGIVFQEPMSSLNPVMTIGKQIAEAILAHQDVSKEAAKQLAKDWLGKVQLPTPEILYSRYPHQLSGGQKQRVMIAMAMCNHPVLLIADEPTTALDASVQHEIIRLMQYLQEENNTALVFITHDLGLAATIADEILVMNQGEVMEYGPAKKVLKDPQHAYTKALLACRPSATQKNKRLPVVSDFMSAASEQQIPASDNKEVESVVTNATGHEMLVQVKNLGIWFAEEKDLLGKPKKYFKAVDDVSFELYKGETLGLVGESGSGKSTISRSLIGLIPVNTGQIIFNGEDLAQLSPREWRPVRKQIQMIFQDPYSSLNPRMTVGDTLIEPLMSHHIVPQRELQKEALRLLDLVHLPADSFSRYPHQFSGGQRQRIGIARALSLRPRLLICDESVSALDVSVQAQILNLLKDLQQEFGLTYLFISHDEAVVNYMSDRTIRMKAGKLTQSLSDQIA